MPNYYNIDLYNVLNVSPDADIDTIKAAYRKYVRMYHPDVTGNDSDVSKFKEIQEAYEILSDEEKRRKYDALHGFYRDKLRKETERKNAEKGFETYKSAVNRAKYKASQKESFTESINDAIENLFGKNIPRKKNVPKPVNGKDINSEVSVTPKEAANGCEKRINILHTSSCPVCSGKKFINGAECSACAGTGQISKQRKLNVKIPKGIYNGAKVRVKGEGNKGENGGKDGDLYLTVNIKNGKFYETDSLNLLVTLPVTPFEAVFGTEISLHIHDSDIKVKIPENAYSGQKLKIHGMGLINKKNTGDLIITLQIKIPSVISEEEKKLYEKLKEISTFDIRKDFYNEK